MCQRDISQFKSPFHRSSPPWLYPLNPQTKEKTTNQLLKVTPWHSPAVMYLRMILKFRNTASIFQVLSAQLCITKFGLWSLRIKSINAMQAFYELIYIFILGNKIIIFLYHAAVDSNFTPSYFSDCFTELLDQKKCLLVVLTEKPAQHYWHSSKVCNLMLTLWIISSLLTSTMFLDFFLFLKILNSSHYLCELPVSP